jgi:hypothetical protein
VAEFFIIGERFGVITRQLVAAAVLSKLSNMNDKSSFAKDPLVITKQLVITMELNPNPHCLGILKAFFCKNVNKS